MIVKMKSIAVFGQQRSTDEILQKLRDVGVLHVSHVKPPEGTALDSVKEEINKVATVLNSLPAKPNGERSSFDAKALSTELYTVVTEIRLAKEERSKLKHEAERVAVLGSFSPEDIAFLSERGIVIRLYECQTKKLGMIPDNAVYALVGQKSSSVAIIGVVSQGKPVEIPFTEIAVPPRSLDQIQKLIGLKASRLAGLNTRLQRYAADRPALEGYMQSLQDDKEFETVKSGLGNAEEFVYVKGFCPVDSIERLSEAAECNGWGLAVDDPEEREDPPTLTKNSKFVQIVNPLFKLLGTVPGYREYDANWCFLSFFCVFFGMIIGDAGYGAIFLTVTAIAHYLLKDKASEKEPFYLMYLLSGCTIVWGSLSGMWFSSQILSGSYPFNLIVSEKLSVFSPASQTYVMNLCFILAVMQFTIAHGMAAIHNRRSVAFFAQIGWLIYMWGIFFLTGNMVLGLSMPPVAVYFLAAGFLLVFLFANAKKTIKETVREILLTLLPTLLGFVGAFADTVSYLRLFAVGLTGFALASSFYDIVSQIGFNSMTAGFFSVLIIVVVHCLNMALAGLGVLVHGLRLNMLEFSSHLGMTWSGYAYKPFRRTTDRG